MTPLTPRPMHAGAIGWHRRLWARLNGTNKVIDARASRLGYMGVQPRGVSGILGPDVSEFQAGVNWQTVGANRIFAFTRATFGTSIIDPTFASYQAGMRQFVQYRAFYHFLVANIPVAAQASLFCKVVGSLQPGETVMLDWEDYGPTGGLPSATMASTFCSVVERTLGLAQTAMLVYSSASTPAIGRPRIIASYGAAPSVAWDFWQYTDGTVNAVTGEPVPGIGKCDQNVFAGSEAQLANYFLPYPSPLEVEPMYEVAKGDGTDANHGAGAVFLVENRVRKYWITDQDWAAWVLSGPLCAGGFQTWAQERLDRIPEYTLIPVNQTSQPVVDGRVLMQSAQKELG